MKIPELVGSAKVYLMRKKVWEANSFADNGTEGKFCSLLLSHIQDGKPY